MVCEDFFGLVWSAKPEDPVPIKKRHMVNLGIRDTVARQLKQLKEDGVVVPHTSEFGPTRA